MKSDSFALLMPMSSNPTASQKPCPAGSLGSRYSPPIACQLVTTQQRLRHSPPIIITDHSLSMAPEHRKSAALDHAAVKWGLPVDRMEGPFPRLEMMPHPPSIL